MKFPSLILIRGLPGSGKSHLARAVVELIGTDKVELLDPDATDYESQAYADMAETLRAERVDEKFYPYRFLRGRAHRAITDKKIIIWTQAFTNLDGFNKTINNLESYAEEHGQKLPLLIVEVEIDSSTAKQRVAERAGKGGHDVAAEAFERFVHDYASFASELSYPIITIDGSSNIDESAKSVLQGLDQLI